MGAIKVDGKPYYYNIISDSWGCHVEVHPKGMVTDGPGKPIIKESIDRNLNESQRDNIVRDLIKKLCG